MTTTAAHAQDLVARLVAVDTQNPGGDERAGLEVLAGELRAAGMQIRIDGYAPGHANLTATATFGSGAGPVVMLNSHIDVVPAGEGWSSDPFAPVFRDGRIYGRGAADAKGSLGAMAAAAVALLRSPGGLSGTLLFTAVGDEEVGSTGARALIDEVRPDFCIVGEPTGIRLLSAHKGSLRPVIEVAGVAAHAATPQQGLNAIDGAARLLDRLDALAGELQSREHPLTGGPTLTPVLIDGGQAPNAVPERCRITLDRRLVPGEDEHGALAEVQTVLDEFSAAEPWTARIAELAPSTGGPSETDPRDPFVGLCQEALRDLAEDPGLSGLVVNCDMTTFRGAGIPTVILGPGTLEVMHAKDEYVDVAQIDRAASVYEAMLRKLLDGARGAGGTEPPE